MRSFDDLLREAIAAKGMSLSRVVAALEERGAPLSLAALSYWRSGARTPERSRRSLDVVRQLEDVLELPEGHLAGAIAVRARARKTAPKWVGALAGLQQEFHEALAELDLDLDVVMDLRVVTHHQKAVIGADGSVSRSSLRMMLRSIERPLPYFVSWQAVVETDGASFVPTEIHVDRGGRVGRRVLHPHGRVFANVVELDAPLTPERTAVLDLEQVFAPGAHRGFTHGYAEHFVVRDLLLWLQFHEDAVPDWIEEVEETESGRRLRFLELDASHSVHVSRSRFGPGTLSVRWGYDRDIWGGRGFHAETTCEGGPP